MISRRTWLHVAAAIAAGLRCARSAAADRPDVPWLAEIQTPHEALLRDALRLPPLLEDAGGRAITTRVAWEARRKKIRRQWLDFLGELRCRRPENRFEVLEQDDRDGCLRQLVRYESEPGILVEAYLLRPLNLAGRAPCVVALHSTRPYTIRQPAGLEGAPETFFGLRLAQRGFVAVCPRCFLWQGEGSYLEHVAAFKKRHPACRGMAKMLWDASRAVDLAASLPEVDASRIAAVGHSLGAKEALYLAAFDERIAAAVSSEGGIGTRMSNWDAEWYLGGDIRNGRWPREHHEVLALIAPRPFLLIGGDSADGAGSWPFIEAAMRVYELYGRPMRIGLFNHHGGHAVPPEAERRLYQWVEAYA